MLQLEQFGNSTGKIVYGKTSQSILSLAKDEVLKQFKLSGLLLFRGFGVSYEEMGEFSKQFSSKFARDPERNQLLQNKLSCWVGVFTLLITPLIYYRLNKQFVVIETSI